MPRLARLSLPERTHHVHVLEPFFTTKPVGAGSGLGLSMVYGFVKQSGGHLKTYSEVGRGTTVNLYLPRAPDGAGASAVPDDMAAIPAGAGESILIVEDDPMVRKLTVRVLAGLGYRTLEAGDAIEAEEVLREAPRIDLLLTDVVLPKGVSGPEFAVTARRARPGLKVLYMSGYPRNAMGSNGMLEDRTHLLSKPFPKAELARRVREILDQEGDE